MRNKKDGGKKMTRQQLAEAEAALSARKRIAAAVMFFALVCALGWQADRLLDVHVKKVQIEGELSEGERKAVRDTISEAIQDSGAAGLHSLSLEEVRSAVSRLSWADRVSARRRWPDTLVVQLMRHTVVARWGGGGFVASNGEVIKPPASQETSQTADAVDLPLLNCQQATSAKAMEVYTVLNRTLSESGLQLVELNESLLGEWTAGVVDGSNSGPKLLVTLGRDDLAPRLRRFLAVRAELLSGENAVARFAAVDARYHNGVAVQFFDSEVSRQQSTISEELVR